MARYDNPFATIGAAGRYPTDPSGAVIGQMLGRILFGDAEARQEQQLNAARMAQIDASTRADDALADSRNLVMKSRGNLAQVFQRLVTPNGSDGLDPPIDQATPPQVQIPVAADVVPTEAPAFRASPDAYTSRGLVPPVSPMGSAASNSIIVPPGLEGVAAAIAQALPAETGGPAPSLVSPGGGGLVPGASAAPEPIAPAPPSGVPVEQFRQNLPELIAALAQADMGSNIDDVLRAAAAFSGNDATARAGLVAGGASPSEDFAITPERADNIRRQGFDQAFRIEGVRDATRRRGQDMSSSDRRYSTDTGSRDRRYATDVGSRDRRYSTDVASGDRRYAADRRGVTPVGDAATIARQIFPNVQITQNRRDPNSALGRANPGSYHNSTGAAIDARRIPGMTFNQYVQRYRDAGYEILEARDEYVNPSPHATGGHWHVVLGQRSGGNASNGGRAGGRTPQPRAVSRPALAAIDAEITGQNLNITGQARQALRQGATIIYQRTGNPVTAVEQAKRLMLTVADRGEGYMINRDWTGITQRRPNNGGSGASRPRPSPAPAAPARQPQRIRYDANGNRIG